MAYQSICNDKLNGIIHVLDDITGWTQHSSHDFHYAYRKKAGGAYKSLFGDDLEKITSYEDGDPSLFESDLNVEMKVLLDLYPGNEEISKGNRIVIYDIETSTEGGFPDVTVGDKAITAIALYDYTTDKYYSLILDPEKKIQDKIDGNQILESFRSEELLLTSFLKIWKKLNPTIISGWNCIPTDANIWTNNEIKKIKSLDVGTTLFDGLVEQVYPVSKKQIWNIHLINGMILPMSKDHKIYTIGKDISQYSDLQNNDGLMVGYSTPQDILNMLDKRDYYVKIPLKINNNKKYKNLEDELFYVMGILYTDGTFYNTNTTLEGAIYNNNLRVINTCKQIFDRNKKMIRVGDGICLDQKCYRTRITFTNYNELTELLPFIYNGKKCLDINLLSKLSSSQFWAFMSGMIDGDGCVLPNGSVTFCNYINDIPKLQELLLWNGIYSTITNNNCQLRISSRQLIDIREKLNLKISYKRDRLKNNRVVDKCRKSNKILFRLSKKEHCVYIKLKSVEKTNKKVDMIDIKTSTSYFNYSGVQVHNCDMFDNPYIYNRIKSVLGKQASYKLSPLGIVYQNKFNKKMTIGGISSLDYINLYKKFLGVMKSSYSLSNVAKDEELKNQKLTYKGNLDDLYKNDIERFIEYNLVDVKIVVELDKKYDFIHLAMAVCHKGHVPYEWFQMSSRWIDGAILDYLHLKNIVAPNKPLDGRETYENMEKEGEDGFIGAYVKDPIPGLYNWVCSADITSLYPSVIMSLNISNETKISKIENWNFEAFNVGKLNEIKIGDLVYTIDEFKKMMEGNKISISSNGVIFKQDVVGVIPFILDKWFSERVEYRALAKKYLDEGIKEKSDFYSRRQLRQKIFLNSIYGVTGLPVSRWYDKDNAEAVTVSGQEIIKGAEKIVNYYFNTKTNIDKDNTIYIDTDSVYFSIEPLAKLNNIIPENMIQFSIDTITEISSGINKFYEYMVPKVFNINSIKNRIKIVPDVIAKKALWLAKKRYAMLKVFDMEKMRLVKDKEGNLGKIEFKGIDVVRSSFPAAFQRFASNALDMILRDIDKGVIGEKILQFEETIGSYSIVDLAKTSSARFISKDGLKNYNPKNRSQFEFVNGSPAQVRSALAYNDLLKVWKLEKQVEEIKNGSKVKWVYLLPNEFFIEQLAIKNDDTDPDKILDFIVVNIDRKKMYERELYSKLKDVYTAIGWSYPNGGSRLAEKTFDFNEEW